MSSAGEPDKMMSGLRARKREEMQLTEERTDSRALTADMEVREVINKAVVRGK
jgi:hypothetical protein